MDKMMGELREICREIRREIFRQAYYAGGAHLGAAFSVADLLGTLYFGDVLRYRPDEPKWEDRDRCILSKGHASAALYAVLALAGYFDREHLKTFCQAGSNLGGHPKRNEIPGVEASTGALGHGLSYAIGIAYANKADQKDSHVYVILGDGECQEGSVWEGALAAPALQLDNLTAVIDHNKLQAMDELEHIIPMQPFAEKWKAFGWHVVEIDGHDYLEIQKALLARKTGKPVLIVAHTRKGKGVSFMEQVPIWHYRMPDSHEQQILMKELGMSQDYLSEQVNLELAGTVCINGCGSKKGIKK